MTSKRFLVSLLLFAPLAPVASGQDAPPAQPPPPPPELRQFDFWVGNWQVTTPDGKVAGHNRIEFILGDRVLQENWTGAGGYVGKSFNIYDIPTGKWRQFWVDKSGLSLVLTGGIVDGSMVLSGERETTNGTVVDRITWTPGDDGSVRQLWETSIDFGKTWTTLFDGLYSRMDRVQGEKGRGD